MRKEGEGEPGCLRCDSLPLRTAQEELALQAFIQGLQPEQLQEHICLYTPRTLMAVLTEAERVEHVLPTGGRPPSMRHHCTSTMTTAGTQENNLAVYRGMLLMTRAGLHCTLLPGTDPMKPSTPAAFKLDWVAQRGNCHPQPALPPLPSHNCGLAIWARHMDWT